MYTNRPFLLKNIGATDTPDVGLKEIIQDCVSAASTALELVDSMASDGTLFHAFWWTHYVSFCALAVVYVWQIQQKAPLFEGRLLDLAESCLVHLAHATDSNSPSRRYSIILQELREEANQHAAGIALRSLFDGSGPPPPDGMGPSATAAADMQGDQQPGSMQENDGPGPAPVQGTDFQQATIVPSSVGEWSSWQTTDWLDIDSLVCAPIYCGPLTHLVRSLNM